VCRDLRQDNMDVRTHERLFREAVEFIVGCATVNAHILMRHAQTSYQFLELF
jgi:hypothetical protein